MYVHTAYILLHCLYQTHAGHAYIVCSDIQSPHYVANGYLITHVIINIRITKDIKDECRCQATSKLFPDHMFPYQSVQFSVNVM
jgi:hypothetical protein